MESAIISLLTNEAFIPSWPIAIPSDTAIQVNSLGVQPDSCTPSLAHCASLPRCILQGVASLHVEETPTNGFSKSLSLRPIALNNALWGALDTPSITFLLTSVIHISCFVFYILRFITINS